MIQEFLRESNLIEGVDNEQADKDAFFAWNRAKVYGEISFGMITEAHLNLLENLDEDIAGIIRTVDVQVGGTKCPSHEKVRELLKVWVEEARDIEGRDIEDLEEWIKAMHVKFEGIHPFEDGNGRVGRLVMNYMREKNGLDILVIKASEREEYYKWFNKKK